MGAPAGRHALGGRGILILSNPGYYDHDSPLDHLILAMEGTALLVLLAAQSGLHTRLATSYGRMVTVRFLAAFADTVPAGCSGDHRIAGEYEGAVKVAKVNVDAEQGLAASFGTSGIPTIAPLERGQRPTVVTGAPARRGWKKPLVSQRSSQILNQHAETDC